MNDVCINPRCKAYGDMGAYVPGISGYQIVDDVSGPLSTAAVNSVVVGCPGATKVIGGGAAVNGYSPGGSGPYLMMSKPYNNGWLAALANPAHLTSNIIAYAICANVTS